MLKLGVHFESRARNKIIEINPERVILFLGELWHGKIAPIH